MEPSIWLWVYGLVAAYLVGSWCIGLFVRPQQGS